MGECGAVFCGSVFRGGGYAVGGDECLDLGRWIADEALTHANGSRADAVTIHSANSSRADPEQPGQFGSG